jgi:hypothetical protein
MFVLLTYSTWCKASAFAYHASAAVTIVSVTPTFQSRSTPRKFVERPRPTSIWTGDANHMRGVFPPICNAQQVYGEKGDGFLFDSWQVCHLQSHQPH